MRRVLFLKWGRCPHAPGIDRFLANSMSGGTAPPCRHLSQRSGRIPALPYPLLKHFHFISSSPHFTGRGASSLWPAVPVAPHHTTYRFSASRSALPANDHRVIARRLHAYFHWRAGGHSIAVTSLPSGSPATNSTARCASARCIHAASARAFAFRFARSEERRVGKERRSRWSP